jgi:hypothetical protein
MRYSLLIVTATVYPLSAVHYYLASRTIEADLGRANEV